MKRSGLIFCLGVLFLAYGCSKPKDVANIEKDIPYHMETPPVTLFDITTVPPSIFALGPITYTMPVFPIPTNSKALIVQYNTSANKLNSVKLTEMSMSLLHPDTGSFNFLSSVYVSISATGLPLVRVAYNNAVPRNTRTVTLIDTTGDLKNYFLQDTINVYITGSFIGFPPPNAVVAVNCSFHMSANPLN